MTCPKCGSDKFYEGPCGGGAQNILCAGCHTEYWEGGPFGLKEMDSTPERIRQLYGVDVGGGPSPNAAEDHGGGSLLDEILGEDDGKTDLAD